MAASHITEWGDCAIEGNLQRMHELRQLGSTPPDHIARLAAQYGHLECLEFVHGQGCSLVDVAGNAATNGNKACLEYAIQQGCDLTGDVLKAAARNSQMECMKVLIASGCPWHCQTAHDIAYSGTMECLIFAYENGCPWDAWTARTAAKRFEAGYCERPFLEYVITHGALDANKPQIDSSWFEELAEKYYWPILRRPYKAMKIQRWYRNRIAARELEQLLPVEIVRRICAWL